MAALWASAVGADPTRPLLTWYDDATGERVELSGVTLDNWVAKTANLLVDGLGLSTGDRATVALPPHWQSAAVLLGCWNAGLTVGSAGAADVLFASTPDASGATDRYLLGFAPMGLPMRGAVPEGWLDYVAEVRTFGDRFTPMTPVDGSDPATDEDDHATLVTRATSRAAELGIKPGSRVLLDLSTDRPVLDWLLAPLSVAATLVLCANPDPGALPRRAESERADTVL
ncbi:acyl-CoA synthetase [Virgisporangium aliadipatigenens]|uniref:Acyl-CoA synthetase n=1 Tax=Virgisporangium aliadipatigenens TaxID=741659 RepID=A0A8J3YSW8_9ACTN|nr:acyl-CoA synthetase [Virgisporangium aliadipatigenens]